MQKIYEPNNALEAHMLVGLLAQSGIECEIRGEYLQGGMGELPAAGLVSVWTHDHHVTDARNIIGEWEKQEPSSKTTSSSSPTSYHQKTVSRWPIFLLGTAVGAGLLFAVDHFPKTDTSFHSPNSDNASVMTQDVNGDGVADEKSTLLNNGMTKIEQDRNFDGKMDSVVVLNDTGLSVEGQQDDDFDGHYETSLIFHQGILKQIDADLNNNGINEHKAEFKHGILYRLTIYNDSDALSVPSYPLPVQVMREYSNGKVQSTKADMNGDGVFEMQYRYNFYELPEAISSP